MDHHTNWWDNLKFANKDNEKIFLSCCDHINLCMGADIEESIRMSKAFDLFLYSMGISDGCGRYKSIGSKQEVDDLPEGTRLIFKSMDGSYKSKIITHEKNLLGLYLKKAGGGISTVPSPTHGWSKIITADTVKHDPGRFMVL